MSDPSIPRTPAGNPGSLLGSPAWRFALLGAAVVSVAVLLTAHLVDLNGLRPDPQPTMRILAHQLAMWALWGIAGVLIVRLARALRARSRSWVLFLLFQVPLSVGVAYAFTETYDRSSTWIYAGTRDRPLPRPHFGPEWGPPRPPPRGALDPGAFPGGALAPPLAGTPAEMERRGFPVRLRFNLIVYWLVLGIGAGVDALVRASDRERLEGELARAQLSSLRDQLHPHFFFNSLHAVAGLIREKRDDEALRVIAAIGDLVRTTLDRGGVQEASLREEARIADRYLDIERTRFGVRLDAVIRIEDAALDARVPALLLQPLVENAVRHGVEPRTEGGKVSVAGRRAGDELEVEVRDDGPGFPEAALAGRVGSSGRRSIGLSNLRERLRLLYGERQSLTLGNTAEGGALVRIRMPYERFAAEGPSRG